MNMSVQISGKYFLAGYTVSMYTLTRKKLYILCNLSLITAAFISGLSFVAQKIGMNFVGPFTFNTLRSFLGFFSLIPLIFLFGKSGKINLRSFNSELFKGGFFSGLILFIAFSINQYCMIYADAGKAGFITSLYIIFVPVIAVFLKHKLTVNVSLSIVIALCGLYMLCAKDTALLGLWDLLLLLSAFFFAMHIITVSHYSKKTDAVKLSCMQFLTAGILSLPLMFIFETPQASEILAGWKPILFIGVIVTAGAYTFQIFGHKATNPVLATLILSSEAVFAVLGGIFILGESLSTREIFGCLVMIFAIILSQIHIKNKKILKETVNE